jgi:hypothetical protein
MRLNAVRSGITPHLSLPSVHPTALTLFVNARHGTDQNEPPRGRRREGHTGDDCWAVGFATQGF